MYESGKLGKMLGNSTVYFDNLGPLHQERYNFVHVEIVQKYWQYRGRDYF